MLTTIYTIFAFCLIIALHEFGHFIVAKAVGITVHEFSIGMGPKLISKTAGGTLYSLRILPIGGYVRLEGEDDDSDDENAFCNKKPWQRFLVLFAGAFMNFVLGFLMFVILFSSSSGIATNVVDSVIPDSAFFDAGIKTGDKIVYMQSDNYKSKIGSYNDIIYYINQSGNVESIITFKRDGKTFKKTIAPKLLNGYEKPILGFVSKKVKPDITNVIPAAYNQSKFVIKAVVESFKDLLVGKVHVSELSGPVGIVNEIDSAAKKGLEVNIWQSILNVMSLVALISINLGVVNLFPLPALDGGRILFLIIEVIRRKPVDRNKEGYFHFVGLVILLLLMLLITYSDIKRLIF